MTLQKHLAVLDLSLLVGQADEEGLSKVYAIGEHPEYAAGLYGFNTTPYFNSLQELETYVEEHWSELYLKFVCYD